MSADSPITSSPEDIALRMFPSMAPALPPAVPAAPAAAAPAEAPPVAAVAAPAPAEQAPAAIEAEDPEMKAVREDPAYRMFGVSEAARALPDNILDRAIGEVIEVDGEVVPFDHEMAERGLSELRTMVADLDLSAGDMALVSQAVVLGESLKADPEKVNAAREQAVEMLNAQHGREAALAARCARAYVAKNPKLANLLERTGAGDSPQAITLIARRALSLHKSGKLTLPSSGDQASPRRGLYAASKMNP